MTMERAKRFNNNSDALRRQGKTNCIIEAALQIIGGRWKAAIIYYLLQGTLRFGELRRALPNCTQRILTLQLRELERDGLITRKVFDQVPPRVDYELTPVGRNLEPALKHLAQWAKAL